MTSSKEQPLDGIEGQPKVVTKAKKGTMLGAMFLMATSAIGPGFLTQTATFTAQLGAAFAFALLLTILIDIAVQMNTWRIIGVSGQRAQDLANKVIPGAGFVLAALVAFGGLVFNIGNIGGTGLGLKNMIGLDPRWGAIISAVLAIGVFLSKKAGVAMDKIVVVLGAVMILLTLYVAIVADPPVGEALKQTVAPEQFSFLIVTTLVGGTVGGYITYSGAHRLVDSGVKGPHQVKQITNSSIIGIIITGVMRALLFLAVLGVVATGTKLTKNNEPASAFQAAAGEVGLRVFGVVLWAAAISSVIGAAYTSVSFLKTLNKKIAKYDNWVVIGFILVSTVVFVLINQPTALLIFAGGVNGLILPIGFGVLLWVGWRRRDLLGDYKYPVWLLVIGVIAWAMSIYLGWNSIEGMSKLWK